eukprot:TRINITY_DN2201_c0_g1_i1.p1 TRINITY_DN2201_c0_g1~~TRINITY_DN2201_c0_g1_i1.p1  ORF type:complete len:185 (-),score=49.06 TRINITY_DN2201_c0_g1_i1:235-789(-)
MRLTLLFAFCAIFIAFLSVPCEARRRVRVEINFQNLFQGLGLPDPNTTTPETPWLLNETIARNLADKTESAYSDAVNTYINTKDATKLQQWFVNVSATYVGYYDALGVTYNATQTLAYTLQFLNTLPAAAQYSSQRKFFKLVDSFSYLDVRTETWGTVSTIGHSTFTKQSNGYFRKNGYTQFAK